MSPERMPSPSTYDPCALSCFRSHLPSSVGPSCLHGSVLTPGEVSVRQGECTEAELASMIRHGMPAVGGPHSCWRRGPDDQPQVIAVDLHRSHAPGQARRWPKLSGIKDEVRAGVPAVKEQPTSILYKEFYVLKDSRHLPSCLWSYSPLQEVGMQTSLTDEIQHETWEKSRISTHDMRG
jgi:hypothetical protein